MTVLLLRAAPPSALAAVGPSGLLPLSAQGALRWAANLRSAPSVTAPILTLLPASTALSIDGWATDSDGAAWYHGMTPSGVGWVNGDAVTTTAGVPANPSALLTPLAGKGMWLTYPVLRQSTAGQIVSAALAAGLTHLYVEVAGSQSGFFGAAGLASLLPAAHRAGLRVLVWVYPYLLDLPSDVALTLAAAEYVAPSGDRPDGLLADVEENMDEGAVRAYGQIVRAALGPGELMAIATYPPQWRWGETYPFATAALSFNVIVPMDYWHLEARAYSAQEVYQFVAQSVQQIRARTTPTEPVEVLGQFYSPDGLGADGPTAAELAACAEAARDSGALGLSYYDWAAATASDWGTLAALPEVGAPAAAVSAPSVTTGSVVTPTAATPVAGPYVLTTVPLLNLRAAPGLDAPVVEQLAAGSKLGFGGYVTRWAKVVAPDGRSGYVYRYDTGPVMGRAASYVDVAVPVANVRAAPSLQALVLTRAVRGARLAVRAVSGAWAEVQTAGGISGWIYRALTRSAGP